MNQARIGLFEVLRDNWSNLSPARIGLFARSTTRYSEEVIREAIQTVLNECEYAPVLAKITAACVQAERALAQRKRTAPRRYRPGDIGPDGSPTFTPEQARVELRRLRAEHPAWFGQSDYRKRIGPASTHSDEMRGELETLVGRLYVTGLRRCANLDGRAFIEASQVNLF